jgi:hypothetical protein
LPGSSFRSRTLPDVGPHSRRGGAESSSSFSGQAPRRRRSRVARRVCWRRSVRGPRPPFGSAREQVASSFTASRAEAWDSVRPRGGASDRGRIGRNEAPLGVGTTEVALLRRGTPGCRGRSPPCRSSAGCSPFPRKPPPTSAKPRCCASARHAARDMDDSSLGVRSPSAFLTRRSLCRFASPTPSALRVSHPLSGLSPPGHRGSVSRHIRPWGLVTAFRAFPSQSAVTPLGARCSLAVPAGSGLSRASSRWAFAPAVVHLLQLTAFRRASVFAPASPTFGSGIFPIADFTEVKPGPSERPKPREG